MTIRKIIDVDVAMPPEGYSHHKAIQKLDDFEEYTLGLFRGIVSRERRDRFLKVKKDIKAIRMALEFDHFLKSTGNYI